MAKQHEVFDPTVLSDAQRIALFEEFPTDKQRIVDLDRHNVAELAAYVAQLSATSPPNDSRPRFEIYGWSPMPAKHYMTFPKRTLIQRICCMEEHDRLRRRNRPVPGVMSEAQAKAVAAPAVATNPVQPPKDIAAEPVRPAPQAGAGSVQPASDAPDQGKESSGKKKGK